MPRSLLEEDGLVLEKSQETELIKQLINENEEQLSGYISSIKENLETKDDIMEEIEDKLACILGKLSERATSKMLSKNHFL